VINATKEMRANLAEVHAPTVPPRVLVHSFVPGTETGQVPENGTTEADEESSGGLGGGVC
jgi:hypothetical protein